MKSIRYKLRAFCSEHVVFFSYRWITWLLALVVILLQSHSTNNPYLSIWLMLLVIAFVMNVVFTSFAQAYVRVVRRRPLVLLLDISASVALVWVSGGAVVPFLPYALGALLLPALMLNWQRALLMSLGFTGLDLWLLVTQPGTAQVDSLASVALRCSIPPIFALLWSGMPWLARRVVMLPLISSSLHSNQTLPAEQAQLVPEPEMPPPQNMVSPRGQVDRGGQQITGDISVMAQFAPLRTTMEQGKPESWRTTFVMQPHPDVDLSIALNHFVNSFRSQSHIEVHMVQIGATRRLSPVQYSTLFRLVQEALLNVQQHAHATMARLVLRYELTAVILTIQDDGVGLLDGTYRRPGVHALRAMHYRLAELDGYLEVFENDNGGVTVRGTLPLMDE